MKQEVDMLEKIFGKEDMKDSKVDGKRLPAKRATSVRKSPASPVSKSGTCEIAFLLDRSGSMGSYVNEAIDGFNDFIDGQKNVPGDAEITLCLFDGSLEYPMSGVPLQSAGHLDRHSYMLGGSTALLDAIGKTMGEMMIRHSSNGHPERVIMVILTDGQDNASREYRAPIIKDMVERAKAFYKWEFIIIGVGVNAEEIAQEIGVDECCALPEAATADGVRRAFEASTQSVAHFRKTGEVRLLKSKN